MNKNKIVQNRTEPNKTKIHKATERHRQIEKERKKERECKTKNNRRNISRYIIIQMLAKIRVRLLVDSESGGDGGAE